MCGRVLGASWDKISLGRSWRPTGWRQPRDLYTPAKISSCVGLNDPTVSPSGGLNDPPMRIKNDNPLVSITPGDLDNDNPWVTLTLTLTGQGLRLITRMHARTQTHTHTHSGSIRPRNNTRVNKIDVRTSILINVGRGHLGCVYYRALDEVHSNEVHYNRVHLHQ